MKYTEQMLAGLGKLERERLSAILRQCQSTITVAQAASTLHLSHQMAAKLLARLARKGWLSRLKRGVYIPVPIESKYSDIPIEDPRLVADKLFSPSYIAGWSAAEHWGMTEQIFTSVVVMTQAQQKDYRPVIKGTEYLLYLAKPSYFFGLKSIWRNDEKIQISDPSRTIVDLMCNPELGGGLRSCADILKSYFASDELSIDFLIDYFAKRSNGAAYKRFGFLCEKYFPEQESLINNCQDKMSTGNAKLDPALNCDKLATRWRLWVPKNWR